jgi:glucoamylase
MAADTDPVVTSAPGAPGIPPTWTSSAKDAVGTAIGTGRVWFSIGHGIVNEVYWPSVDHPQVRDVGFIVADGAGFWIEVKRLADRSVRTEEPGVPAVISEFVHPRFRLTLRICASTARDVLLVEAVLRPLDGTTLRLYPLLAPHLGRTGTDNTARVVHGPLGPAIVAERRPYALALASSAFPGQASVGFVGSSDGWQDFDRNGAMTWVHTLAEGGNVAGMLELPAVGPATLALGFGGRAEQALAVATAALHEPFELHWERSRASWRSYQYGLHPPALPDDLVELYRSSAAVLRCHEDRAAPGAFIASLSIPWGDTGDDPGGYHLVWSRDLVESAGALLAIGDVESAARVFAYLAATQLPDGSWPQNQWVDGRSYWTGSQLDEAALPVLLAGALRDAGALQPRDDRAPLLDREAVTRVVQSAVRFLVRNGPATSQDRWEEDAGLAPSTLAPVVAALVVGARFLAEPSATTVLETADAWNTEIERWTYATGTSLARAAGVEGTYLRVTSVAVLSGAPVDSEVAIRNRPGDVARTPATEMVSPDVLALVRFGLRRADDPRILATLAVVDATLRTETPSGPVWHRYSGDGYGETEAGEPFRGVGVGRGWPLLTGERGHHAVAAGLDALPYLRSMAAMAAGVGLFPEQVWDMDTRADMGLLPGRPTGSAMPLSWAHAEFLKLCHSWVSGVVSDLPLPVWERWQGQPPYQVRSSWRLAWPVSDLPDGQTLRIELLAPATVRWSADGWETLHDVPAWDTGIGLWLVDISPANRGPGRVIVFTMRWANADRWEGRDFTVTFTADDRARQGR